MKLDESLQLHVLSMLLFSPEGPTIRSTIPLECWTSDPGINALVTQTYEYIDIYRESPNRMVYDLLTTLPVSDDLKVRVKNLINACEASYPDIKVGWINNRLEKFHQGAIWETAMQKGLKLLELGRYEELDNVMQAARQKRLETFEPGYTLADVVLNAIQERDNPQTRKKINMGIPDFEKRGINPGESELFMWIAPAKRGKSWGLSYCGRQGISQGLKVAHLTLEMDQQKMGIRYLQSVQAFYSRAILDRQFVRLNQRDGVYTGYNIENSKPVPHINDPNYLESLYEAYTGADRWISDNLRIKQFPTGSLKIEQLQTYLTQLRQTGFFPDALIIDYIDLMFQKVGRDSSANRDNNTNLYKEVRGLLIEEKLIGVSATQGNRAGASTETTSETVSENYLKIAQVDCAVAINQKPAEKKAGLARLTVTSSRNSEDGFTVVVEQDLSIGQFAIRSQNHDHNGFKNTYEEILKAFTGEDAA